MNGFPKGRFKGDPGDTIYWSRYGEHTPHLYVVVTAPYGDPPRVVIVNLTSKQSHSDTTVVLLSSDHPFIDRETVVNYNKAGSVCLERLKHEIEDGTAKPEAPFSAHLLKTIQQGILDSARTPRGIKELCRRMWQEQSR